MRGGTSPEQTVTRSEAEATACVRYGDSEGMKPVKVVTRSSLSSKRNMVKVVRAVNSPYGDERNPRLKLRQGPLFERVARTGSLVSTIRANWMEGGILK